MCDTGQTRTYFSIMYDHLKDLAEGGEDDSSLKYVEIEDMMTDIAGILRDETFLCQHVHRMSTLTDKLYLNVYPVRP